MIVGYMYDNGIFDEMEGIGLPAVYATTTFMEPERDEWQMNATDFIQKGVKTRIAEMPHPRYD